MDEEVLYNFLMGPAKVLKILIIILISATIIFASIIFFVETLVETQTSALLSDVKMSYDSGYYGMQIKESALAKIEIKALDFNTGEEISEANNNFPNYGDIIKVQIKTTKPSMNIFDKKPIEFVKYLTVVNRGTFGSGYKYERK